MKEKKNSENETNYLAIYMCIGLVLGIAVDNIALGLCIGVAIGAGLDHRKKKESKDEA